MCRACGVELVGGAPAPAAAPYASAAPPQGYGEAPQGWGAPPPPQGWGAPPPQQGWVPQQYGGGYGAPAPYGMAPAGYGYGAPALGPTGTTRDPVAVLVFSFFCFYGFYVAWVMLHELQAFTQDENFKPWKILIPWYNLYFWWSEVPEQVTKAKRMAGCLNPYATGFYQHANVALYSLAKDLNECWTQSSMRR